MQKLRPIFMDATNKVHHQERLSNELKRRNRWKFNVILLCDNRDEFIQSFGLAKLKHVIFPSRRRLSKDITIRSYPDCSRPCFHIIRHGKCQYRIVKLKKKPQKSWWLRSIEFDTAKGYFRALGGKWYCMDMSDFGCDACDEQGFCRCGHHEQSFCGVARSVGFVLYGNCWYEAEDNDKSAVEYINPTKHIPHP